MATSTQPPPDWQPSEGRLLLRDVGWDDYEAMLEIVGERHIRVTFDRGTMEVTMPSQRHEQAAQLLGLFVPILAEELELPYEPLGMTTWRKPEAEKGLEPDQCYYIQNRAVVREREVLDLEVDPPPDVAIEVDITSSSLNRMGIYAELCVPEVWRYDGHSVTMFALQANCTYAPCAESLSFPGLRPADVERLVELGRAMDKLRWSRELRDWVQNELIPRRRGDGTPPQG
jgi:Uma2 family endonuclease